MMNKALLVAGLCFTVSFGFGKIDDLSGKGLQLYKQGQFKKALEVFGQLQSLNTAYDTNIRYNMANCFYRLGEISRAIETYREVIDNTDRQKRPVFLSKVYFNLGNAYALKSDEYKNKEQVKNQRYKIKSLR